MKVIARSNYIFASLIVALFAVVWVGISVNAQSTTMSSEQMNRIRANCISAKNTLNQLHANDALLRVNRGQLYESMATKLMNRFNSRASFNQYKIDDLTEITKNYSLALTTFRQNYQLYEQQLSAALRIDCSKEPAEFYAATMSARTKRTQVHVDVVILHQYIDTYKSNFESFAKTRLEESGKK